MSILNRIIQGAKQGATTGDARGAGGRSAAGGRRGPTRPAAGGSRNLAGVARRLLSKR